MQGWSLKWVGYYLTEADFLGCPREACSFCRSRFLYLSWWRDCICTWSGWNGYVKNASRRLKGIQMCLPEPIFIGDEMLWQRAVLREAYNSARRFSCIPPTAGMGKK
jgi:hypothetical protein